MQSPPGEPSMEDILASIKKVIAEEKELRASALAVTPATSPHDEDGEDDILELDDHFAPHSHSQPAPEPQADVQPQPPAPPPGPPLVSDDAAAASRQRLVALQQVAAAAPPVAAVNPLEQVIRDMLKPILKEWLDRHLPEIVDEHVRREISRITGAEL